MSSSIDAVSQRRSAVTSGMLRATRRLMAGGFSNLCCQRVTASSTRERTWRCSGRSGTRPAPDETFTDRRSLEIGGERIQLEWHGSNHTPDNSFIHFPDHDTLMLVDIVNAGWVPIYSLNLAVDVPGYIEAPATALSYPWTHLISGHMGRLGTRDDLTLQQQYVADLSAGARTALGTVDPTPFFVKYGNNSWAAIKGYLDAVADSAAAPVIQKYPGVLAAADVFTASTALWVLESIRLDLGVGIQVRA